MLALISAGQLGLAGRAGIRPFQEVWGSVSGGALSELNRVAGQTSAATEMRVITSSEIPTTGKWYAEVALGDTTQPGGFFMACGIGTALSGGSYAAARSNASTAFISGGVTAATQATWNNGQLRLALDYPNRKIWVGLNSSWFASGDPGADSNPYFSTVFDGPWYIWAHADNDNNGTGVATLCTSAAHQLYSPPSGFSVLTA